MLHSGGERRSVIGWDFGENLRVEWWNCGSRLKAREKERMSWDMRSFLLACWYAKEVQQRIKCRDIGVENHWLNEVRLSTSWGLFSRGWLNWDVLRWGLRSWGLLSWGLRSWGVLSWGFRSWGLLSWGLRSWGWLSWDLRSWGEYDGRCGSIMEASKVETRHNEKRNMDLLL